MLSRLLPLTNRVLGGEKAPYAVTLFVAGGRVDGGPHCGSSEQHTICGVSVRTRSGQRQRGIRLRLRNVTAATRFECFLLTLTPHAGETLKFGDAALHEARLRGTVFARPIVVRAEPYEWEVRVKP